MYQSGPEMMLLHLVARMKVGPARFLRELLIAIMKKRSPARNFIRVNLYTPDKYLRLIYSEFIKDLSLSALVMKYFEKACLRS